MLYGVKINGVDTLETWGLILLSDLVETPPARKENLVPVPGADGVLDLSEALTGEPVYDTRSVSGTLFRCADQWTMKYLSGMLLDKYHGQRITLTVPSDLFHHYAGVLQIGEYSEDAPGRIPFSIPLADPWRYKNEVTTVTARLTSTEYVTLYLTNERRRVVPTFTVTAAIRVRWRGTVYTLQPGHDFRDLDIRLDPGENTIEAALVAAGTGEISITYQEARL